MYSHARNAVLIVSRVGTVFGIVVFLVSGWWIVQVQLSNSWWFGVKAGAVIAGRGSLLGFKSVGVYPSLRGWSMWNYCELESLQEGGGIPLWVPIALCAATWLVVSRFVRSFPLGQCQKCGYDLRASTIRCPECGLEIASEASCETEA